MTDQPQIRAVRGSDGAERAIERAAYEIRRVIAGQDVLLERTFVALLARGQVTGDTATKAKAAAVKAVGGTAGAVTTDFPGTGYEVTVTKADGTTVEVHLDSSYTVTQGHHGFGH